MAYHTETDGTPYIYIAGYASQGNFLGGDAGYTNVWPMKLDTELEPIWHRTMRGEPSHQYPWDVAVDEEDNVYVLGQTFSGRRSRRWAAPSMGRPTAAGPMATSRA